MESDPLWAAPHITAAYAHLNMGDLAAAKDERQKARSLVPEGYEFEGDYAPHFQHLDEAIEQYESKLPKKQ